MFKVRPIAVYQSKLRSPQNPSRFHNDIPIIPIIHIHRPAAIKLLTTLVLLAGAAVRAAVLPGLAEDILRRTTEVGTNVGSYLRGPLLYTRLDLFRGR